MTSPGNSPVQELSPQKSSRAFQRALVLLALAASAGVCLAIWLGALPMGNPDPRAWSNVFYALFARNEPAGLALVAIFSVGTLLWYRRGAPCIRWPRIASDRQLIVAIALGILALTALGTWLVFHNHALTADENMSNFQARLFAHGKIYQQIPAFWEPMLNAVMPTYATYLPGKHAWMSGYLPVYAAIRAVFMSVNLDWLTNPAMAAISVLALGAVARKVWPKDPWKPVLAAGLLAASPQFLLTSMTAYAMPAHLALNLVWLWLYCDPAKRRFWLAPFVGVLAVGLHQPFFHAMFSAPFLLRLVLERRWKASLWFAAVYLIGISGCYAWWYYFVPANTNGAANAFALHSFTLLNQAVYAGLLLGWLALPVPLMAAFGFAGFRRLPPLLQDACMSCIFTLGLYIFVASDQAHGWGDRYFHGTLGCLVLVSVAGWDSLVEKIGRKPAVTFASVGIAAALVCQLPLRSVQAEQFARPYARAAEFMQNLDAGVVAFDPRMAWYSNDLKRNDPLWQRGPMIVSTLGVTKAGAEALRRRYPKGRFITREELAAFGLVTEPFR